MIIPNDTGHPYRLNKFVEYQHKVPAINPVTLLGWLDYVGGKALPDDLIMLAWYNSVTYSAVTAIFLHQELNWRKETRASLEKFWLENKAKLEFNSARRYAKNMDWFVTLIAEFLAKTEGTPHKFLKTITGKNGKENYATIFKWARSVPFTGRFAADLFLEMLLWYWKTGLLGIPLEEPLTTDWRENSNLTSGLMNVFYLDKEADEFDNSGRLYALPEFLDAKLREVQLAIRKQYPKQEASLPLVQIKLCSFRNLFKGTRYGGYHHDRQLENIRSYEARYPKHKLWGSLYALRRQVFAPELLGELGGWTGIRKERKKLWLTTGRTGVERE